MCGATRKTSAIARHLHEFETQLRLFEMKKAHPNIARTEVRRRHADHDMAHP